MKFSHNYLTQPAYELIVWDITLLPVSLVPYFVEFVQSFQNRWFLHHTVCRFKVHNPSQDRVSWRYRSASWNCRMISRSKHPMLKEQRFHGCWRSKPSRKECYLPPHLPWPPIVYHPLKECQVTGSYLYTLGEKTDLTDTQSVKVIWRIKLECSNYWWLRNVFKWNKHTQNFRTKCSISVPSQFLHMYRRCGLLHKLL